MTGVDMDRGDVGMALKHIEDKDDAENIEAARKAFNIDQAMKIARRQQDSKRRARERGW